MREDAAYKGMRWVRGGSVRRDLLRVRIDDYDHQPVVRAVSEFNTNKYGLNQFGFPRVRATVQRMYRTKVMVEVFGVDRSRIRDSDRTRLENILVTHIANVAPMMVAFSLRWRRVLMPPQEIQPWHTHTPDRYERWCLGFLDTQTKEWVPILEGPVAPGKALTSEARRDARMETQVVTLPFPRFRTPQPQVRPSWEVPLAPPRSLAVAEFEPTPLDFQLSRARFELSWYQHHHPAYPAFKPAYILSRGRIGEQLVFFEDGMIVLHSEVKNRVMPGLKAVASGR